MRKILLFVFFTNYLQAVDIVDTVNFTLKENKKLKMYEVDTKISKNSIDKSSASFYPKLDLYMNAKETRGSVDNLKETLADKRGSLAVRLNLFNGFSDSSNLNASKNNHYAKESLFTYQQNKTSLESIKAHLNIVYKNRLYNIELENIKQDKELLRLSKSISSVIGDITPTIEVETDLDYAKSAANEAYKGIGESIFEYKMLTGVSAKADEFTWPMIDENLLTSVKDKIKNQNDLIKTYCYQIKQIDDEIQSKRGAYFPKIDLAGEYNKYTINGNDRLDDDRVVKLELRYNLFNGFYDKAEIEQKKLQRLRMSYEKKDSIDKIIKDTKTVRYTTKVYKNLIAQDKKTLKSLLKLRGLYMKQFSVGKRAINDIIDLQKKIVSIKKDLVLNQFSVKINYFYLLSHTGELVEFIKKYDIFRATDSLGDVDISYSMSKKKKKIQKSSLVSKKTKITKRSSNTSLKAKYSAMIGVFDDIKSAKKLLRRYNPHSYMLRTGSGHYIVYYGAFKYKKSAKEFLKKIKSDGTVIAIKDIELLLEKEQNQDAKLSLIASMR